MEIEKCIYRISGLILLFLFVTACEKDDPDQPEDDLRLIVPDRFQTIQAAIDASFNGDTIIVMPGVYPENIDFKGKNIILQSSAPENADSVALTIIDGGGNGPVVKFENGESKDAILYGFTIRNGDVGRTVNGGGIRITNGSSPIIKSNIIKLNSASYGAGILVSNESEPTILMNTITENTAIGSRGAGIYVINQSHAIIKDNVFSNHEDVDGVIHIGGSNAGHKSSAIITGNIIDNNSTTFGTGGIKVTVESEAVIEGNTITNNHGVGDNSPGAILINHNSVAEIINNDITGNSGSSSGAILIYRESNATITGNTISENSAGNQEGSKGSGGGIMLSYHGSATITDNVISNNEAWSATHGGGGIAVYSWGQETHAVIDNNEITSNKANRRGGGIYITGTQTTALIKDNDISDNTAGNHNQAAGGAMYFGDIQESIIHDNVISNNHSNWRGGGIYFHRNAVVKDAQGNDWPAINYPPTDEPYNTYSNNTHVDDVHMGSNVFFED